uniref:Uncharacterized protein n=1 Tax=Manihot esculenta TaxID=3983 RepID=A0A2C9VFU3_MANES
MADKADQCKSHVKFHLELLKKENEDKKLLSKCVQELKMKRVEFDLLREVDILRRDKSLHVEKKAGGSDKLTQLL